MKPSLTNADECHLVNTELSDKDGGEGACIRPPSPPQPPPTALRKTSVVALTQFAVYCGSRHA